LAKWIWISFGVASGVSRWMAVLHVGPQSTSPNEKRVSGVIRPICLNGVFWVYFCIRIVCEKLTIFLYGQNIIRNVCSLAF